MRQHKRANLRITCVAAGAALAIVGATLPEAASAQSKVAFCNEYADQAVAQQRRNLDLRCGYQGLRWHEWWDGHFGWCKDWVSEATAEEELELRSIQLCKCVGDDRYERRSDRRSD